jgi:hypothetical protein
MVAHGRKPYMWVVKLVSSIKITKNYMYAVGTISQSLESEIKKFMHMQEFSHLNYVSAPENQDCILEQKQF